MITMDLILSLFFFNVYKMCLNKYIFLFFYSRPSNISIRSPWCVLFICTLTPLLLHYQTPVWFVHKIKHSLHATTIQRSSIFICNKMYKMLVLTSPVWTRYWTSENKRRVKLALLPAEIQLKTHVLFSPSSFLFSSFFYHLVWPSYY